MHQLSEPHFKQFDSLRYGYLFSRQGAGFAVCAVLHVYVCVCQQNNPNRLLDSHTQQAGRQVVSLDANTQRCLVIAEMKTPQKAASAFTQ